MGIARLSIAAVTSLLLGAVATTVSTDSSACGNATIIGGSGEAHVKITETEINEGKVFEGYNTLIPVFSPALTFNANRKDPWVERAYVVAARAAVRSEGVLLVPPAPGKLSESWRVDRVTNLKRAEELLRLASEAKPDDAIAKADLAEARAKFPEKVGEAKRALVELEAKGIMPSAWGYAVLTRLRDGAGAGRANWLRASMVATDKAPREVSHSRCAAMTKKPEICATGTVEIRAVPSAYQQTIATDAPTPTTDGSPKSAAPHPVKSPG